jgi:hypothetical protein
MTPYDIANKTRKVIEMSKDDAMIKGVYFNPLFASRLKSKVPELKEAKLYVTVTETETERGTIKAGYIRSMQSGDKLKLGSIRLDGEDVHISQKLVTIDRLIEFIESEAVDIAAKTINEKEEEREAKLEEETVAPSKSWYSIF